MIYVTYSPSGALTGCYRQAVHPDHAGTAIEVSDEIAQNWTAYQANAGRDGVELAPYVVALPTVEDYDKALTAHLDATAQGKRYADRISCSVRAGYTGPFQAEGIAFATWMDTCNAVGYQMLADFTAGNIPQPTIAEMIAALPAMVWPS